VHSFSNAILCQQQAESFRAACLDEGAEALPRCGARDINQRSVYYSDGQQPIYYTYLDVRFKIPMDYKI
jgi:hypothetical protein